MLRQSQKSSRRNEETSKNFAQDKQSVYEESKTSPKPKSFNHSQILRYLQAHSGMGL
jgi:hypothetical protein